MRLKGKQSLKNSCLLDHPTEAVLNSEDKLRVTGRKDMEGICTKYSTNLFA